MPCVKMKKTKFTVFFLFSFAFISFYEKSEYKLLIFVTIDDSIEIHKQNNDWLNMSI